MKKLMAVILASALMTASAFASTITGTEAIRYLSFLNYTNDYAPEGLRGVGPRGGACTIKAKRSSNRLSLTITRVSSGEKLAKVTLPDSAEVNETSGGSATRGYYTSYRFRTFNGDWQMIRLTSYEDTANFDLELSETGRVGDLVKCAWDENS